MKFLIDAQLPRRLANWLLAAGYDAIHTLDLPQGNLTSDREIIAIADSQGRTIVTKDSDFVQSFILNGRPQKLWLIATGNMRNDALERLIAKNWEYISSELASANFIELSSSGLIVHE